MIEPHEVPVLFLIFNRPRETAQVFERIRQAKPRQLFIAGDGPRHDRPNERSQVEATRAIAIAVDWACEVKTRFSEDNLGCRRAVSSALDWFFGQVPHGIVLEDDCLPSPSFFRYCSELLARYRDDNRVWHITGCNFDAPASITPFSYDFCSYPQVWGWASWADRWARYDRHMAAWPRLRKQIGTRLGWRFAERLNHTTKLDRTFLGQIDTWDYQWHVTVMEQSGLCVAPGVNLITNLGFGDAATHTKNTSDPRAHLISEEMTFPMRHPAEIAANRDLDRHYIATMSGASPFRSVARFCVRDWRYRLKFRRSLLQA